MGKSKAKSASQAILMPSLAQITDPNSPGEAPGGDHLLQGPPLPVESGQEQLVLALHDVALTSARKQEGRRKGGKEDRRTGGKEDRRTEKQEERGQDCKRTREQEKRRRRG